MLPVITPRKGDQSAVRCVSPMFDMQDNSVPSFALKLRRVAVPSGHKVEAGKVGQICNLSLAKAGINHFLTAALQRVTQVEQKQKQAPGGKGDAPVWVFSDA